MIKSKIFGLINRIIYPVWSWNLNRSLGKYSVDDQIHLTNLKEYYKEYYITLTNPLITVYIPTYNRAQLLIERSVKSVLKQSYKNIELIVVGDCTPDNTHEKLSELNDDRIVFFNLPNRPPYPKNKKARWMTIGSYARNLALEIAKGDWIAYLDDDDEWENDHLKKMVDATYANPKAEFLYGGYKREVSQGEWLVRQNNNFLTGKPPFKNTYILHSSVMYRKYLSFMKYPTDSFKVGRALDYYLTQRLARSGIVWYFVKDLYVRQPLRPGEITSTYNSISNKWPENLDFILLRIFKNVRF